MSIFPTEEHTVAFTSGDAGRLEGRLHRATDAPAVVITHPHPGYGGDLDHPVVALLTGLYQQHGYTTLRFNFRSVGARDETDDEGRGERADLQAAADYLAGLGQTVTDLAGYSLGAWINLSLDPPLATVRRQVLISPPVAFIPFGVIPPVAAELLIVTGDRDAFAPPANVQEQARRWHPQAQLQVLPGVDHFYGNALDSLAAIVNAWLVERMTS
jgi:alpha/beta superfamily hydrolase